jgi:predicted ATPase
MLAGRTEQLRVLERALAEAIAGRGGMVVLGGEAGIGKSAIAEALAAHAEKHGAGTAGYLFGTIRTDHGRRPPSRC